LGEAQLAREAAEAERQSIVWAAIAVGWIIIWAFVVAQLFLSPQTLPRPNVGAAVAASAAWFAFVLGLSALVDLLRSILSHPRLTPLIRSRWLPLIAVGAGLLFARFGWSQLWPQ
jgi:hypothetical protein